METNVTNEYWKSEQEKELQRLKLSVETRTIFYLGEERTKEAVNAHSSSHPQFWYSLETLLEDLTRDRDRLNYLRKEGLIINPEDNRCCPYRNR